MPGTNQFLPFAVGAGANTLTPTAYAALASLLSNGFVSGVANSAQFNTALRQATTAAAGLAQFIANQGTNVNDDGNPANFATLLQAAIGTSSTSKLQSVQASVAASALTVGVSATTLDFRNATLTSGAPIAGVAVPALTLTVPSGATLGTVNAVAARLVLLVAYNAGTPVLCVTNLAGGLQLDETNLISPTTISSGATSAGVIYSASAVSANSPYRVVGFVDITEATAGTWATDATLKQGIGGQALAALSSFGFGQTLQSVTRSLGVTYYNNTGRPITCIGYFLSLANNVTAGILLSINGGPGVLVGQCGGSAVNQSAGNFTAPIPAYSSYRFDSGSATNFAVSEIR